MSISNQMFDAAVALITRRYPTGWGGAAAVRLGTGEIVTSVAPDTDLDVVAVCMELGGFLEAHKQNQPVTHCLCIYRDAETEPFKVLSPCGVCQESLRFWGPDVMVAISHPSNALIFKPLRALQPHHWSQVFQPNESKDLP